MVAGGRILDIGVGTGRTTRALLQISEDYIGVDYSARMIENCRRGHPRIRLAVCDARNLSAFDTGAFDLVMFSFNGLDYMDHASRRTALAEIHRVLRPGGFFVFSAHNRQFPLRRPWNLRRIVSGGRRKMVKELLSLPISIVNHVRNVRYERQEAEHCLRNDAAHLFTMITYYIGAIGFDDVRVAGMDGRWLDTDAAIAACKDVWGYYVCRKRGAPVAGRG